MFEVKNTLDRTLILLGDCEADQSAVIKMLAKHYTFFARNSVILWLFVDKVTGGKHLLTGIVFN